MDDKENFVPMGTFGNGCMVFSPPAKVEKPKARPAAVESLPTLMTARFQKTLPIEFGTVSVHATSVQRFRLINPIESKSVTVSVDKVAGDKGFSVVLGDGDTVVIPAGGSVIGAVYWKPANDMSVATTVTLKLNDNSPLQLTLRGIAGSGQVRQDRHSEGVSIITIIAIVIIRGSATMDSNLSPSSHFLFLLVETGASCSRGKGRFRHKTQGPCCNCRQQQPRQ